MSQNPQARRYRAHLSQFSTSILQTKNPWVVAFFAFSYPGFGHLLLHRYIAGFILIIWEMFINGKANVNLGILYTLTGNFGEAKEVMDERWLMLYVGIYMFGIWDSYRTTVDLNKQYILADREDASLRPNAMGAWDINFMDKRKPWVAVTWSALFPGLGHLYVHKVIAGFFIFAYTVAIMYFGHIPEGIQYTMLGKFSEVKKVVDMQWLLYLPSIYFFILYDAYNSTVDYNLLFEKEMKKFLRENYQKNKFIFPF
ncbi:hypothetical protein MLOOGBEN_10015 [Bacillus sp. EB106-08-02-XG196]|uniref:hypothetical protein n=1 Tax=Bacillus sp. EB106-08-02-XG196 TaxID=2737049 RepID=UPI0015C4AEFD|nr:hypothetical protein [Bacillus sp. EB106-08-02-XG196]NWQ41030.1 hypothetical protein [Bacillus sp. EB106-08-02-XG196]